MTSADSRRWPAVVVVAVLLLAPATASLGAANGHGTSIPVNDSDAAPAPADVDVADGVTQEVVGDDDGEALVFDSSGSAVDFASDCGYLHVSLDVGELPREALTDETEVEVELADDGGFLGGFFGDDQFAVGGTSINRDDGRVEFVVEVEGCEEGDASAVAIDSIELTDLDLSDATPGEVRYRTGAYFVNSSDGEGRDAFGGGAFDDALDGDVYGLAPFEVVDATDPEADAGDDQTVDAGETVTFDGSGSSDDVAIESYEWDVDEDGEYELEGESPTHDFDEPGSYEVELLVTDAGGNTDTDSVTVDVEERAAPTANDDAAEVGEGGSVEIDVLANDEHPDGDVDESTVSVTSGPASGSTTVDEATGVVTYSHDGSDATDDSFRYVVDDAEGATSNEATVDVTVTEVNEPPAVDPIEDRTLAEEETETVEVTASDPDGDTVGLALADGPAFASFEDGGDGTGTLTLAPGPGDAGEHPVTVTATDGDATANATLTVTVTGEGDDGDVGSGSSSGGGGSAVSGSDDGSSDPGVSTSKPSPNEVEVEVTDLQPGEPLTVRLPAFEGEAGAGTQLVGFVVRPAASGDLELLIERTGAPPGETPDLGDDGVGLAYFTVDHDVPDEDVSSVTLGFRVEKARLDDAGADPGSVTVYRYEEDGWASYDTRQVDEDADAYYFTADVPGFSQFAVGAEPAATEEAQTGADTATADPAAGDTEQPSTEGTPAGGPVESEGGFDLGAIAVLGAIVTLFVVGYFGGGPLYEWYRRP